MRPYTWLHAGRVENNTRTEAPRIFSHCTHVGRNICSCLEDSVESGYSGYFAGRNKCRGSGKDVTHMGWSNLELNEIKISLNFSSI